MSTAQRLLAGLLLAALSQPVVASPGQEAQQALNRYAVAFTLHYLCGRNPLGSGVFGGYAPEQLDEALGAVLSPELMQLAGVVNRQPVVFEKACDVNGVLADQYPVLEVTDQLLVGLRTLDGRGDAQRAFENGTWFRLMGLDTNFEQHVDSLNERLKTTAVQIVVIANHSP